MKWTFENYRLDTEDASLWRDDEEISLRPKTFDVLCYLVEHAGELVSKENLLEEVWKNSYVVEGVLTTSMSELRKLFGDTARNQRFIATVYRRGYRFVARVNELQFAEQEPAAGVSRASDESAVTGDISKFPRLRLLIGRDQECNRLVEQLADDPECRILSLVGPGGIGKTHLAIMIAQRLAQRAEHPFEDGFYFIRLQSLEEVDEFCSAIAKGLGLQSSGEESPQQHLQSFLSDKRMLLVIDNFEYYLDSQKLLAELISSAADIKILLTSRESLSIEDAWFHPVRGLEYGHSTEAEAIQLFAHLAQQNQPEFDINEKLPVMLRICEMVEGVPLALELAAGWLKMLSMDEVADEISQGIDILAKQYGDVSGRHTSLRAVYNETWQRLTQSERTLLQQLSIFRGGTNREAIREIIGASLPMLARLINKALLYTTAQLRYHMHELIRQYAEEELGADSEFETDARDRHARYYLEFMANQYEPLCDDRQAAACNAIQVDFDNIRTAWYWALSRQQFDWLQDTIRIVFFYSELRGHLHEGLAMLEAAQTALEGSDYPQRNLLLGRIKTRAGILNFFLSRYDSALALFEEVRQISEIEIEFEQTFVLRYLGDYHFNHSGHFTSDESKQFLEACIEQSAPFGNTHTQIECLCQLAFFYTNLVIDIEQSHRYAAEAVERARKLANPDVLAYALHVHAWTLNHRGDYAAAEKAWQEALDLATRAGHRRYVALITNWLGWSAWSVMQLEEAYELFSQALKMHQDLGDRDYASMCYADLATVLLEQGELERARENCRSGLELAEKIGRDDHHVYNTFVQGAVECSAGNFDLARKQLSRAMQQAWSQEEQTNRTMVVYYVARLLYADFQQNPDTAGPGALRNIILVLRFLQVYPTTWQAFRDRAKQFEQAILLERGEQTFDQVLKLSDEKITEQALKLIPGLL